MSGNGIGRLEIADLRAAWPHEALNFTPWLFENLDVLGEAIGLRLTPEGAEIVVETFSADILARNARDDSLVLIENQLEGSDHTHLGQIMTYLAGLEVKTVIWIAREFRDSHLSAIKWLNEHTADEFSFFAVKLKVGRIGDSPFSPLLEVLECPNAWERQLHAATVAQREGTSERGQQRLAFWTAYNARVPGEQERGGNVWRVLDDYGLIISRDTLMNWLGNGALILPLKQLLGRERMPWNSRPSQLPWWEKHTSTSGTTDRVLSKRMFHASCRRGHQ
jgi:hypothetical protein